jgi:hypothetical protein
MALLQHHRVHVYPTHFRRQLRLIIWIRLKSRLVLRTCGCRLRPSPRRSFALAQWNHVFQCHTFLLNVQLFIIKYMDFHMGN